MRSRNVATRCLSLLLGAAAAASALAQESDPIPLTLTETRIGFFGFSVVPAQADNWFLRKAPEGVWLLRRMDPQKYDPKVHSFAATVFSGRVAAAPQSLEEFVALRKARDVTEDGRLKILKHDEAAEALADAFCSRFSITAEDSAAPYAPKLILEVRGIGCAHPQARDFVVSVAYSERSPNGGITESFAAEGEQILRSLKFGPLTESRKVGELVRDFEKTPDQSKLAEIRRYAQLGYPAAQWAMGRTLGMGYASDVQHPNRKEGLDWFLRAADQGLSGAQFNLGLCYAEGTGVAIDYTEARKWFLRAHQQYYKDAERALKQVDKVLTERSANSESDRKKARELRQRAEAEDREAQFELGAMYEDGRGMPADMAAAITWYGKSASLGYAHAQFYLGAIFDYARGVPQNDAEAVKWYTQAAEQGNGQAQFNLFAMYRQGRGVARDDQISRSWLRKAAATGHPAAKAWMRRLGDG
jgi:hypothetical protein